MEICSPLGAEVMAGGMICVALGEADLSDLELIPLSEQWATGLDRCPGSTVPHWYAGSWGRAWHEKWSCVKSS